eukprot:12591455-Alexandrium_andersonii.AAC.1
MATKIARPKRAQVWPPELLAGAFFLLLFALSDESLPGALGARSGWRLALSMDMILITAMLME